jgi:hypothetical protein
MAYQSKLFCVFGSLKLALASAVVAGLVAFTTPVQAITINDNESNGLVADVFNVGFFGIGDFLISHRSWDDTFAGDILDITYVFTASGDSPTRSTATALNPNPPAQGNFGIANLILTWADGGGILSSQQFTDANGVLDTTLILTQVLTDTKNFTLQLTGTLLNGGGGYIVRVEAIPLPAGLLLFLSGLAGIGFLGRYKARRQEPAVV